MTEKAILEGEEVMENDSIDEFIEKTMPINQVTHENILDITTITHDFEINKRGFLEVFHPSFDKHLRVDQEVLKDPMLTYKNEIQFRASGFNGDLLLEEIECIFNGFYKLHKNKL